jgi:hypothetical protein
MLYIYILSSIQLILMIELLILFIMLIELLLFNAKWTIYLLYHGVNKLCIRLDVNDAHFILT